MNRAVLIQSLKQMWGIILLEYRYHGNLPDIETYCSAVQYSMPFEGEWVVVNGGVTKETSHSWEIPTQRYAYDFLILDDKGNSFKGEETTPESFYCYGKDILSPAEGVIAEVGTECPDSKITKERKASCSGRDIRGNYILIQHAEKEYSLLAHLKPGSICVRTGQQVNLGEKIGECGNSGNTSEPHLHFQIQSGKSFYSSFGLPVSFSNIYAKETAAYEKFDGRNLQEKGKSLFPPYIGIGQTVGNKNIPPGTAAGMDRDKKTILEAV